MSEIMRRDTAGFIMAGLFTGLYVVYAAVCLYLYWTYGWVTCVFGALISQQILAIALLLSWFWVDKAFEEMTSRESAVVDSVVWLPHDPFN